MPPRAAKSTRPATRPSRPATPEIPPISTLNWILTFVVLSIPLLNIPIFLVGAFAPGIHPNKRTFCRAKIIILLVLFVVPISLFFITGLAQNIDWAELGRAIQDQLAEPPKE